MARIDIELDPIDFITIGTIGPKGKRVFHLQAGKGTRLISFTLEKEQAWALSEAIGELVDDLDERTNEQTQVDINSMDMDLREPIKPIFRIAQMGLSYDEDRHMIVLRASEMVTPFDGDDDPSDQAGVVTMYCTREQMRALSEQAMYAVKSGRPDPKQNGRLVYYWT